LISGPPAEAAFPGANGKIAFTQSGGINVVNQDGSGRAQIFADPYALKPTWSPDGTKIAFASKRDDPSPGTCSPCNYELYVIDADGGNLHRVTNDADVDFSPSWSPDGSQLAFTRGDHVWTIGADGADATAVTTFTTGGLLWDATTSPAWSPDRAEIAFSGHYDDGHVRSGVFAIGPDGTGLRVLTPEGATGDSPDWAPDGSRLVLALDANDYPFSELVTIPRVAGDGATHRLGRPAAAPVWSPDGTRLLVDGQSGGFVTMNPDGSDPQTVPNSGFFRPDWQPIPAPPDGKNRSKACKAERERLGEAEFVAKYGGGASAHGRCVSRKG
jgi:Tol biopolymer transport system component